MSFKKISALLLSVVFLFNLTAEYARGNSFSLPVTYNAGKDFHLEYVSGKTDNVVFLIQDLHCHYDTQVKIYDFIKNLSQDENFNKLYIEGLSKDADEHYFKHLPQYIQKPVLEDMLKEGKIGGGEYYFLTSPDIALYGLENKGTYDENAERLEYILNAQEEILPALSAMKEQIKTLKKKLLKKDTRKKLLALTKYEDGKINQKRYYKYLKEEAARNEINIDNYPQIQSASQLQTKINRKKAEKQLKELLENLKNVLPYRQYQELTLSGDILSKIASASRNNNIDISKYGKLSKYIALYEAEKNINPLELIEEEKRLINAIVLKSAETSELETVVLSAAFDKFEKFLQNKASDAQYAYLSAFGLETLRELYFKNTKDESMNRIIEYAEICDKYYKVNIERNEEFANKIEAGLNKEKRYSAAITGGFHTNDLKRILLRKGINVAVLTPKISKGIEEAEEKYIMRLGEQAGKTGISAFALNAFIEEGEKTQLIDNLNLIQNLHKEEQFGEKPLEEIIEEVVEAYNREYNAEKKNAVESKGLKVVINKKMYEVKTDGEGETVDITLKTGREYEREIKFGKNLKMVLDERLPKGHLFLADTEKGEIRVNKDIFNIYNGLPLPRGVKKFLFYAAGVISHEVLHLRGHGEGYAYAMSHILPALSMTVFYVALGSFVDATLFNSIFLVAVPAYLIINAVWNLIVKNTGKNFAPVKLALTVLLTASMLSSSLDMAREQIPNQSSFIERPGYKNYSVVPEELDWQLMSADLAVEDDKIESDIAIYLNPEFNRLIDALANSGDEYEFFKVPIIRYKLAVNIRREIELNMEELNYNSIKTYTQYWIDLYLEFKDKVFIDKNTHILVLSNNEAGIFDGDDYDKRFGIDVLEKVLEEANVKIPEENIRNIFFDAVKEDSNKKAMENAILGIADNYVPGNKWAIQLDGHGGPADDWYFYLQGGIGQLFDNTKFHYSEIADLMRQLSEKGVNLEDITIWATNCYAAFGIKAIADDLAEDGLTPPIMFIAADEAGKLNYSHGDGGKDSTSVNLENYYSKVRNDKDYITLGDLINSEISAVQTRFRVFLPLEDIKETSDNAASDAGYDIDFLFDKAVINFTDSLVMYEEELQIIKNAVLEAIKLKYPDAVPADISEDMILQELNIYKEYQGIDVFSKPGHIFINDYELADIARGINQNSDRQIVYIEGELIGSNSLRITDISDSTVILSTSELTDMMRKLRGPGAGYTLAIIFDINSEDSKAVKNFICEFDGDITIVSPGIIDRLKNKGLNAGNIALTDIYSAFDGNTVLISRRLSENAETYDLSEDVILNIRQSARDIYDSWKENDVVDYPGANGFATDLISLTQSVPYKIFEQIIINTIQANGLPKFLNYDAHGNMREYNLFFLIQSKFNANLNKYTYSDPDFYVELSLEEGKFSAVFTDSASGKTEIKSFESAEALAEYFINESACDRIILNVKGTQDLKEYYPYMQELYNTLKSEGTSFSEIVLTKDFTKYSDYKSSATPDLILKGGIALSSGLGAVNTSAQIEPTPSVDVNYTNLWMKTSDAIDSMSMSAIFTAIVLIGIANVFILQGIMIPIIAMFMPFIFSFTPAIIYFAAKALSMLNGSAYKNAETQTESQNISSEDYHADLTAAQTEIAEKILAGEAEIQSDKDISALKNYAIDVYKKENIEILNDVISLLQKNEKFSDKASMHLALTALSHIKSQIDAIYNREVRSDNLTESINTPQPVSAILSAA